MTLQENFPLQLYNSFGINSLARWFASFANADEVKEFLPVTPTRKILILGGGSNVLFTGNYDGLILHNRIPGIRLLHEDEEHVYVQAGAGENWHAFVQYCISKNWAGVENLSLIPGCVGAAPMQNIGAYGVELEDVFWDLEALHLADGHLQTFTHSDCGFGYRESVFKNKYQGQFIILNVTFRLRKKPIFHTSYGAINHELESMGVSELSIRAISEAVIRIRRAKLPDPAIIGNAGSFFKNPSVSAEQFSRLKAKWPDMVGYPQAGGLVKLAAAWLIEACGWKGFRQGDAGCHERQALVLVNYGRASGQDILALSEKIQKSVLDRFGVHLEREVNVVES